MVISPTSDVGNFLKEALPVSRFEVKSVGLETWKILSLTKQQSPRVAVIDRVHEHPEKSQDILTFLKEICPKARVIALSEEPSLADAQLVEQGLFYYLASPTGPDLVRIVEAASQTRQPQNQEFES